MDKPARRIEWLVWGGLMLIIAAVGGAFAWSKKVDLAGRPLPVLGQIPDFALVNQNSGPVSLASLRGRVWLADIIFTRCPGPCAQMTRRLAELQSALPKGDSVRLVSFTSDPEYDT